MQAQLFPVDESDRDSFLQRAAAAIAPLLDLLYQKAFFTYDSIFEPSISAFDKRFRVQNAQRLLKWVSQWSCVLLLHATCMQDVLLAVGCPGSACEHGQTSAVLPGPAEGEGAQRQLHGHHPGVRPRVSPCSGNTGTF